MCVLSIGSNSILINLKNNIDYSQEREGAEWINRQDVRIMHGYEYLINLLNYVGSLFCVT
jgi:hypothetical protein